MSTMRDKRVDGEYDRPLPERIAEPTKEEKERLEKLVIDSQKKLDVIER